MRGLLRGISRKPFQRSRSRCLERQQLRTEITGPQLRRPPAIHPRANFLGCLEKRSPRHSALQPRSRRLGKRARADASALKACLRVVLARLPDGLTAKGLTATARDGVWKVCLPTLSSRGGDVHGTYSATAPQATVRRVNTRISRAGTSDSVGSKVSHDSVRRLPVEAVFCLSSGRLSVARVSSDDGCQQDVGQETGPRREGGTDTLSHASQLTVESGRAGRAATEAREVEAVG